MDHLSKAAIALTDLTVKLGQGCFFLKTLAVWGIGDNKSVWLGMTEALLPDAAGNGSGWSTPAILALARAALRASASMS